MVLLFGIQYVNSFLSHLEFFASIYQQILLIEVLHCGENETDQLQTCIIQIFCSNITIH